ncbi:MAG: nucleotidyltransferase domain-containing protein [Lachnospiraceae bacterium]|nr:nucleotidyltransferase domain-containing protein [Lachnospiraceae bacterium]
MGNCIEDLALNDDIIEKVKDEATKMIRQLMKDDVIEIILYGSCSRGDYSEDSDIDIAIITRCDRIEAKKYDDGLASIATALAMKYFAVVNFVSLPFSEFEQKKAWYAYFRNIATEGEVIYG